MTQTTYELEQKHFDREPRDLYKSLNKKWKELCERYLPVTCEDSIWRYSRQAIFGDPEQGWKLHIAATILTASRVLETVAPFLLSQNVLFKAPASLRELSKINSGIYYGYSQVGKFITVYPQTTKAAARLARRLHQLTNGICAPSVPYELKYRGDSSIYYRYGAFTFQELEGADGQCALVLRDLKGNLVPDLRDSAMSKPDWVADLFPLKCAPRRAEAVETPLKTTYRAFRALSQRGKGGVYQAVDFSVTPPRLCVLKEGRKNGEVGLDGHDGYWRIKFEEHVLSSLSAAGVSVPRVYSAFRAEKNNYLALEYIKGETLERWLGRRRKRLEVKRALRYGIQLSMLISGIHRAGWAWRDCKLSNIILTKESELRPLDFEGACPVSQPDPQPWGTPSFTPPEWCDEFHGQSRLPEDLYALGAIIYLMMTGCLPDALSVLPIEKLRRHVPAAASKVIMELLDHDPKRRPRAAMVARRLGTAL